jgi:hypothetical protein
MTIVLLNFGSLSLAQELNYISDNVLETAPVTELFYKDNACTDTGIADSFAEPIGFWFSDSSSDVGIYELDDNQPSDILEVSQSFINDNEADAPEIELKKYISGNRLGPGRSFGLSIWMTENLGLGFVIDRGEPVLQILNHPTENFFLGPRYRF